MKLLANPLLLSRKHNLCGTFQDFIVRRTSHIETIEVYKEQKAYWKTKLVEVKQEKVESIHRL